MIFSNPHHPSGVSQTEIIPLNTNTVSPYFQLKLFTEASLLMLCYAMLWRVWRVTAASKLLVAF